MAISIIGFELQKDDNICQSGANHLHAHVNEYRKKK